MSGGHRIAAAVHRGSSAATSATEQDNPVAADLGRITLVAVFVVPLARLQPAFDVDLLALGEVLSQRFRGLSPKHDAMPLSLFLTLAGFVVPHLGCCHVQRRNSGAARRIAQLGIAAKIAHQNYLVHTAHWGSPSSRGSSVQLPQILPQIQATKDTNTEPRKKHSRSHAIIEIWCSGLSIVPVIGVRAFGP